MTLRWVDSGEVSRGGRSQLAEAKSLTVRFPFVQLAVATEEMCGQGKVHITHEVTADPLPAGSATVVAVDFNVPPSYSFATIDPDEPAPL